MIPPVFAAVKIFFQSSESWPTGVIFLVVADQPCTCMEMNRPGYFVKVFGRIVAAADSRDLELELDQFRIEKIEQQVISPLAVDRRKFEVFVVKALLDAGPGGLFAHLVVFVGRALHIIHGRIPRVHEAGHEHLSQAKILGPGDSARLVFPSSLMSKCELSHLTPRSVKIFRSSAPFVLGETAEAGIGITHRRAELNGLKSGLRRAV